MERPSRLRLTDAAVGRLPYSDNGQYIVRDTELAGFFVRIGRRSKTYTAQTDVRALGRRRTSKRKALGSHGDVSAREARSRARQWLATAANGAARPSKALTLRQAWERYRESHLIRKGRSPRTIAAYQDDVERLFADWRDVPLALLGENRDRVAKRHDEITAHHGPIAANRAMRTLRAIYRYARKRMDDSLPPAPTSAVDFNRQRRRNTAILPDEFPRWWAELNALSNPIRREFHLFMLLSGSRPDALRRSRWEHLNVGRRVLHFPDPKGGENKAFDMPLSRAMLRCLARARRAGRMAHLHLSRTWIFPGNTSEGHIAEHKERRTALSKWGGDLRQTYRTVAQAVGINDVDVHMLMNHSLPGVNAGYITRGALLGHLVQQQEMISRHVMHLLVE